MQTIADGQRSPASPGPDSITDNVQALENILTRFINRFENYLLIFVLGGLFAGI